MASKETYSCRSCGGKKTADAAADGVPECCDTPMEKMPEMDSCRVSSTPEHARLDETGEPCDDGRSGKI